MSYRRHNYRADIAGPTWVYRLFDGKKLLYVGVSSDPDNRIALHQRRPWGSSINQVEMTLYDSRSSAFDAERRAILSESPIHNAARPLAEGQA